MNFGRSIRTILVPLVAAAVVSSPTVLEANEWKCQCGCRNSSCVNYMGICYGKQKGKLELYSAGYDLYSDVDNESGTITHLFDSLLVDNVKKNHSWGYYFEIPVYSRHYLHWDARLHVLDIEGQSSAGLTMEGLGTGINFSVNRLGTAELSFVKANDSAAAIDTFSLPKELKDSVKEGNFTLGIEYDIRMCVFVAKINDIPVKKIELPYFGIPEFSSVVGFSMQTSNPEHTSIGKVTYGDLSAAGSNDFFPNTML